jgi:hypothetical protein
MFIGVIQSSRFFQGGGTPVDPFIENVLMNQTQYTLEVSFDVGQPEQCKAPYIDYVSILGTTIKGETLTVVTDGFFSASSYAEGVHLYQWYRADNIRSSGSAISGATGATHILVDADVGKYLRCIVTPVQIGGINNQGDPVTSIYTPAIADNVFNPITNLTWFTAHRPSGVVDISTNQYWLNEGTLGGANSTRNGSDPMPTYNGSQDAAEFTNSLSRELVLDLPNPQYGMPVEIWVRAKLKTQIPGWQRMMSFSTDHLIEVRNTGGVYLSGGNTGYTFPTNQWGVFRFVISGTSNTSKINLNNGEFVNNAVPAVTFAIGVNNGRIGANNSGTGTFADAYISHIFVKSVELTSEQQADMWSWFAANAPWD